MEQIHLIIMYSMYLLRISETCMLSLIVLIARLNMYVRGERASFDDITSYKTNIDSKLGSCIYDYDVIYCNDIHCKRDQPVADSRVMMDRQIHQPAANTLLPRPANTNVDPVILRSATTSNVDLYPSIKGQGHQELFQDPANHQPSLIIIIIIIIV